MWRLPSRGLALAALLGAALLQGHTRVDVGAQRARFHDASLVAAAGAVRPIEPRLTGGFAYAPYSDAAPAASRQRPARLYAAVARLERLAQADPRPEPLRVLGVAYLLLGRSDQAIDTLERALIAAPDDPRTLSDLAAILLSQSRAPEDTWDAVRALDYAERAWRKAPDQPEAAFNVALARERLSLRSEARKAWLAVERLDPSAAWATEAARHVAALSTQTVAQAWPRVKQDLSDRIAAGTPVDPGHAADLARRFPQAIREYLQEDLLSAWAAAHLAGEATTAARRLTSADALCAALARDGDGSCRAVVDHVTEASGPARTRLAGAHRTFGRAMAFYRDHRFEESEPLFEAARTAFSATAPVITPEARWCDIQLAVIDSFAGRTARAEARLQAALRDTTDRDAADRGRMSWLLGWFDVTRERFASALTHYERSHLAYDQARESENRARVDELTAAVLEKVGSRRDAWQHFGRALEGLTGTHTVTARQTILVGVSFAGLDDDLPSAAAAFQNELIEGDPPLRDPVAIAESLLYLFESHSRLGDAAAATRTLQLARQTLAQVADATMQRRFEAEITLREGRALDGPASARAVALLSRSLDLFERGSLTYRLPEVFEARGQARLLSGDQSGARTDFMAGLTAVENRARALRDEALRASALQPAWPLVNDLIRLELSQGRTLDALAYAERAKSRSLGPVDAFACRADAADCWTRPLAEGTAVVYYALLGDRLAIWVLTHGGSTMVTTPISADHLRALVRQYRRALEERQSDAAIVSLSSQLFDAVIRPVWPRIQQSGALAFVPDDALHGLPFGALFDTERRRYLIEDHVVVVSPTFQHVVASVTAGVDWREARRLRTVVVSNPTTSGFISARLPSLPGAEAEAAHMSRLFADVRLLRNADATKAHLRDALPGAAILHLASHARVNYRAPWLSYFVLAPDASPAKDGGAGLTRRGEDVLFMSEISALPLSGLRLAVLAACGSADGAFAPGGASLSLARPFLSAGVPHVVASLWPLSDRAAVVLFTDFYSQVSRGSPPAIALREAQLAMLRNHAAGFQSPAYWAAVVVIGGLSSESRDGRGES